jgi:hypothetical protein
MIPTTWLSPLSLIPTTAPEGLVAYISTACRTNSSPLPSDAELSGWRLKFDVKRGRRYVRLVKDDFKLRGKSGVFKIVDRQNRLVRYFAASLTECSRCKSGSSNTAEVDLHISEDEESSSQKTRFFVRICESHKYCISYYNQFCFLRSGQILFVYNSIYIAKAEISSRNISWG